MYSYLNIKLIVYMYAYNTLPLLKTYYSNRLPLCVTCIQIVVTNIFILKNICYIQLIPKNIQIWIYWEGNKQGDWISKYIRLVNIVWIYLNMKFIILKSFKYIWISEYSPKRLVPRFVFRTRTTLENFPIFITPSI